MRKEDFVALGISEELAEKAAEASKEEFKDYIPRTRLNEEIQKKKAAEESYESVKTELEKLKGSAGNNAELQKQITDLQNELKTKETAYANQISEMKMTNAIIAAVSGQAQDADIVAGLLDRSKLVLSDDGKLTGLDEQVKSLVEAKPFLFKPGTTYPEVDDKGEPRRTGGKKTRDQFADWLNDTLNE